MRFVTLRSLFCVFDFSNMKLSFSPVFFRLRKSARAGAGIALLVLLSGCALNQERQTLKAIEQLDFNLQQRLTRLEQQNQAQSQQLNSLKSELKNTDRALQQLQQSQQQLAAQISSKPKKSQPQPVNSAARQGDKIVLGSKEWVWLDAAQQNFRARVDSGATTSSMHAPNPVFFERNGHEWVRFNLFGGTDADSPETPALANDEAEHQNTDNPDRTGGASDGQQADNASSLLAGVSADQSPDNSAGNTERNRLAPGTIEAPIVRWVRIIQASSDEAERRPVIEAWIQVGGLREKAEFTLADRGNMTFPVLLGREFFKDVALIDVGKSYIHPKQKPVLPVADN